MKVEMWADVVCPWCGLESRRLDGAVHRFTHGDEVEVIHRSFLNNRAFPEGQALSVRELLEAKRGMTRSEVETKGARLEALAQSEGLRPYRVVDNRSGNAALAHELLAYATSEGRHTEAWSRIFRAHFGEGRSIFELESLVDLAVEIGLDHDAARAAMVSRRYRPRIEADEQRARQLGITGVPFIVIDDHLVIAGAEPMEVLLHALERAWQARRGSESWSPTAAGGKSAFCEID